MMSKVKTLSLQDVILQSEGNIVSDMNGEKVMLSIQKGKYYNLGRVGGDIWNAIGDSSVTVKDIIFSIQSSYTIDPDTCNQDVISFLQDLLDEDLIRFATAE